ncbi:2-amino-4-hydroxy-6-hydroxymethyldihydropteridinediphosphokinase [Aureimonas altamirensis DSM 21988]|uniref:2-amino-4-hydroxy-6-hydroxymethyldihydropteridine pyrophosphokinase n=1 Tax=Aureimonas altamirensis DSM 21988 TaxID=1121026 RepID=A0ABY1IMT9_9HYPH|nr:2-amino-4-hydroxy-6-hydroxymethyldihydropteridine diphosphokinase [Aureimonas altamirensis]SHJ50340.1 2-amino-4-hydroxy-6-hydroxymethyldihydropteridinediphosphokinase [Aureimonas altamirensis DSM 21988]
MTRAQIGLGGNMGDPAASMAEALRLLDRTQGVSVTRASRLYRTPPWGRLDQPEFLNACADLDVSLEPQSLLDLALQLEARLKRVRVERWGPRTIDIDVLAYGQSSIETPTLTLPHPRIRERAFVLMPLAELAPDLMIEGRTVRHWLAQLDVSGIEPVSDDGEWWHRL